MDTNATTQIKIMESLRGSIKEINVEKASKFIRKLRSEWRIRGDEAVHR